MLNDSVELQKLKQKNSQLADVVKQKSKMIKNLQDTVSYYKKLSQKNCSNSSVS